ncbi:hypothetical protein Brsp07_03634 [Brucella sp. NBRC 14130]|uniref:hypothetical protein n=1 Tax=Brucella sp. NBRC 14130 TaxID=3075483 RepID=UPI0030B0D005
MIDFIQNNALLCITCAIAVYGAGLAYVTRNNMLRIAKIVDEEFVPRDEMNPILKVIATHSNDIQALKERQ